MNKEFIVLSDGNVAITNENGQISKRPYSNNSQEILLLENKIEIFNNKLKKLKKDLNDQEGVVFVSKWMLISQPIVLFLITTGLFIYGGLTSSSEFLTYAIYNGVKGFAYGSIISGTVAVYFGVTKQIYNKKAEKTRTEFFISTRLRQSYEKELSDMKEKQLIIESPIISVNESVSLIEETNTMENQIDEEINKTYTEIEELPKKLILRRKNNQ